MATLETRRDGKFFYITFNRPHRKNAIDTETYIRLAEVLNEANRDPDVVFTVFTGKGDFFSSGSDFDPKQLQKDENARNLDGPKLPPYFGFISQLIDHTKILIALVHGPAIGIGVTLLAHFDLIIASDKSYFVTPFTQLGLSVEGSSSWTFLNHFGRIPASRLLLFSEKIDAAQAQQIGLVSHVVPHSQFDQSCKQHLERLKGLAPQSLLQSKARIINDAVRKELWHAHVEEKALLAKRYGETELYEFMLRKFGKTSKL